MLAIFTVDSKFIPLDVNFNISVFFWEIDILSNLFHGFRPILANTLRASQGECSCWYMLMSSFILALQPAQHCKHRLFGGGGWQHDRKVSLDSAIVYIIPSHIRGWGYQIGPVYVFVCVPVSTLSVGLFGVQNQDLVERLALTIYQRRSKVIGQGR